jgi:hypothetical protein
MSVIKFLIYSIILVNLSSCRALHKVDMFFTTCSGSKHLNCIDWGKDVYLFKSKLKKLDNYDELTSLEGVDNNGNKLRDDVEIFIDFYFKDKLGYPENYINYLRQYATMLDTYSRWAPNENLIKQFAKDNQETLNCSFRIGSYYKVNAPRQILHRNQIRYMVLKSATQKTRLDYGFIYPSERFVPREPNVATHIFIKKSCHFTIQNYEKIFQSELTHEGSRGIKTIRVDLKRFEKKYGTQYREIYEHLLK